MNKLVEIPPHDWLKLRNLFLSNWPRNINGYFTVDNFVQWYKKDPNIKNLHFYSLNGDWSDGTFVCVDRYQLFISSLEESNERLTQTLMLLDWSNGFKVSSFCARHRPAVLAVVVSKGLEKEFDSLTNMFYYPKEKADLLDLNTPPNIILKSLSRKHADIANEVWPNRHVGSLFFLRRLIDWNPNIGAFTKDDDQLVAWCFRLQSGALGALQTTESHTRQGLGSLVTKAMVKDLANRGMDTFALVGVINTVSQKMFERIGFNVIDQVWWLRTYPMDKRVAQWQD